MESSRDLLTRHEKTLHVREYQEPEPTSRRASRKQDQSSPTNSARTKSARYEKDTADEPSTGGDFEVSEIVVAIPDSSRQPSLNNVIRAERVAPEPVSTTIDPGVRMPPIVDEHEGDLSALPQLSPPNAAFSSNGEVARPENMNGPAADPFFRSQDAGEPPNQDMDDFFPILDESLFAQVPFPLEIMDVDFSPHSHGIGENAFFSASADLPSGQSGDRTDLFVEAGMVSDAWFGSSGGILPGQSRPQSLRKSDKAKRAAIDDSLRSQILNELRESYQLDAEQLRQLPSSRTLDRFLSRFFQCFQRHLPIFHVPTFSSSTCPTPLLVAICSIGALYTLNRSHAATLRVIANDALQASRARKYTGGCAQNEPIWQTQCNMLISFGAMFGGSSSDTADAMNDLGWFLRLFTLRRTKLANRMQETPVLTWEQWIEIESIIRLLCGIYIASSLNSATYDVSPGFSGFRDLHFPLPAEEELWEAPTEEEWQLRINSHPPRVASTVAEVLKQLVFSLDTELPSLPRTDIGAFATTIAMHGVNVHMYYLSQSSSTLLNTSNGDEPFDRALRLNQHSQTERTLSRCHEFLKAWQITHDDVEHSRHEDSFIFNCQALLRLSYVRAFSGMQHFNRTTLLYDEEADIYAAVQTYVTAHQARNAFLTKAAEQVMFCFTSPIRAGHMLTRKTAAFTWSIEHAVASWECTLFLSKWIYAVETHASGLPPNDDERRILGLLKEALQDAESPCDDGRSLAAQVTTTWALFMDDVWVWEVTTRMGKVLRQLADAYALSWEEYRSTNY